MTQKVDIKNRLISSLFIALLISSSGCLVKKPEPKEDETDSSSISIVARGLFTVKETLYYSNGKDIYCAFDTWEKAEYFKSKQGNQQIYDLQELPDSMKFIPVCKVDFLLDDGQSIQRKSQ